MADSNYNSQYTGAQIDSAYTCKPEAVSQATFDALSAVGQPTSKLYIITDGTNANTLWRSTGSAWVRVGGTASGGGSGGGSDIQALISPAQVVSELGDLYGLKWMANNTTYRIVHPKIVSDGSSGSDSLFKLVFE